MFFTDRLFVCVWAAAGRKCGLAGKRRKVFLADADGNALSSAVYDQFGDWLGDRAWVRNDQKFGIIGKQGQEMLPVVYENFILDFTESGLLAKQNGKWGFIDWKGGVVIPFQYDFVTDSYSNGLIGVNVGGESTDKSIRGGKWGFVNKKGRIICVPKYSYVGSDCQDDVIWVNAGGSIDAEGNVTGGKFGLVNAAGKEVAFLKYDDVAAARQAYRESLEKVRWKRTELNLLCMIKRRGKWFPKLTINIGNGPETGRLFPIIRNSVISIRTERKLSRSYTTI